MSVTGVCSICRASGAQRVCDRCGSVVCDTHHDARGVCTDCAPDAGDHPPPGRR
ncbi:MULTISPECIES: hypothetical protein [Halobacterium]|uniref:hypothetical protein n=1 Tax=Halobacterium TaxID=2239 RepID=UPI0019657C2F|nr:MULTISPECIES: hypothetical protein [Halobacterium]MCF2164854.1 hypothetical protein [Halobacterium salinarum]MCF2168521.1 hypothetical protein [Halobacterium salinarum]MCF2239300.1 hypothetical protein [Halobacterium salinarum]QRY21979.1 hypothetical protein JT689_08085 [Halobacterium sp. GSL-19]WJK63367.1 hypothetical protein QSJ49_09085 [Halobacterium salinarum]